MKSPGEETIVHVRTVEDLMEMAPGFQRSMVLFAAMDLGVFSALAGGPSDAASLARRLCADPRRLAILLDALVGAGLRRIARGSGPPSWRRGFPCGRGSGSSTWGEGPERTRSSGRNGTPARAWRSSTPRKPSRSP